MRVLIADDSPSMRRAIRLVLETLPNLEICAVAKNGTEAAEAAVALKPDLLILDLVMPGLNGVEVAAIVKNRLPRAKVILFTMYGDTVGKNVAEFAGVDIVIEKSKGLSLLTQRIASVSSDLD